MSAKVIKKATAKESLDRLTTARKEAGKELGKLRLF